MLLRLSFGSNGNSAFVAVDFELIHLNVRGELVVIGPESQRIDRHQKAAARLLASEIADLHFAAPHLAREQNLHCLSVMPIE